MYKLTCIFGCACFVSVFMQAQPVLTSSGNFVPGESFLFYKCINSNISTGATGANVTWHYNTLSPIFLVPDTISIHTCTATPYCSSFPSSNVSTRYASANFDNYSYLAASTTALATLGWASGATSVSTLSDPIDQYRYPFTYTDSFSDAYSGVVQNVIFIKGSIKVVCDGYGTLVLPFGSFANVLRLHRWQQQTDSSTTGVFTATYEIFEWISNATHFPLLYIVRSDQDTQVSYYQPLATSIEEPILIGNVKLYPNPARRLININFFLAKEAEVSFVIQDMTGRKMLSLESKNYKNGANKISLPLEHLAPGLYLLHISEGDCTVSRKIEVY